jgi:hypothetical protein
MKNPPPGQRREADDLSEAPIENYQNLNLIVQ